MQTNTFVDPLDGRIITTNGAGAISVWTGEQGEMGWEGDLLANRALGFPFQPDQARSAFIRFIYFDVLSKILFERM